MKIKGKRIEYVKLKRTRRRLQASPRIIRVGGGETRPARIMRLRKGSLAIRPKAMVSKAVDAGISATGAVVKQYTNAGVANVVENIMTTGKTAAGNYVNKVAAERFARAKQKLGVRVLAPEFVEVAAETLNPGERATVHMDSTTTSQRNVQGNTIGKVYKLNDTFTVARSKWLREKMKDTVKNTIVLRDDNVDYEAASGARTVEVARRAYSTCGLNRKGLYYPYTDTPTIGGLSANKEFYAAAGTYYIGNLNYPTHGFYAQDYNAAAYVQLMLAWFQSSVFTQEQRDQLRVTLPVTSKKLVSTITNRNAFTPVDFTLYVVQNKGTFGNGTTPMAALYNNIGGIPAKYLYPVVSQDSYNDAGVSQSNFPIQTETSMHLKATPFMSKAFTQNFKVIRVHKFTLAPNDIMEYSLSCAMNGLPLKAFTDSIHSAGGYSWQTGPTAWNLPLAGDYSLMLTFQGGVKTTAGFARVVDGVKSFPRGMATDNVTVPCEVSMRSKVSMDVLDDDYYDQKSTNNYSKKLWNGLQNYIDDPGNSVQLRRNVFFEDLALRKPREYPPLFNVAADELVDPDTTSTTGWYTQVQSKVSWKTVNQQSTPS